ncbi:MAG: hypothetical protein KJ880_07435 [Candidatus Omnitrophica bacterium]|nr:hypothetical protein [Candidatus Omnitrophota bacterium]MBU1869403.1 hypothetical protein [Candidatus Omnitrophota bacterium]
MKEAIRNKEVEEGKFFAVISYISFLCVVSLLLKKDNKFVLYHAKQGLVLFVIEVVGFIFSIVPPLGWFYRVFGVAIFIVVSLLGAYNAYKGVFFGLPWISNAAEKISL